MERKYRLILDTDVRVGLHVYGNCSGEHAYVILEVHPDGKGGLLRRLGGGMLQVDNIVGGWMEILLEGITYELRTTEEETSSEKTRDW